MDWDLRLVHNVFTVSTFDQGWRWTSSTQDLGIGAEGISALWHDKTEDKLHFQIVSDGI